MKIAIFLLLLIPWTLPAEELPVHTLDRTLSLGKAAFGASPAHQQANGLRITHLETSPDGRGQRWKLEAAEDLGLDTAIPGELLFIEGMLYQITLHPQDEAQQVLLRRLALRFTANDEMQPSQIFDIRYENPEMFSAAFFQIRARPLVTLAEGFQAELRGGFEDFEAIRRSR